jgi:uncharacterized LabA/DUF88 family protein
MILINMESSLPPPTTDPSQIDLSGPIPKGLSCEEKLAFIKKKAQIKGFTYLSGDYIDRDSKFFFTCQAGHKIHVRWKLFRRDEFQCPVCQKEPNPTPAAQLEPPSKPSHQPNETAAEPIGENAVSTPLNDPLKNQEIEGYNTQLPLLVSFSNLDLSPICGNCAQLFAKFLPCIRKEYKTPSTDTICVFCQTPISIPIDIPQMQALQSIFPKMNFVIDTINYKIATKSYRISPLTAEEFHKLKDMPKRIELVQKLALEDSHLALNIATHTGHSDQLMKACLKNKECIVQYIIDILKEPSDYILRYLKTHNWWAEYAQIAGFFTIPLTDQEYAKVKAANAQSTYLQAYFSRWDPNLFLEKMKTNEPLLEFERDIPKGLLSVLREPFMRGNLLFNTPTSHEIFKLISTAPLSQLVRYSTGYFPLLNQAKPEPPMFKAEEAPIVQRDYYFFDLNNIIARMKDFISAKSMQVLSFWDKIEKIFHQSVDFVVYMFYSRQNAEFCKTLKSIIEKEGLGEKVIWYEESQPKGAHYSDIDTALTAYAVAKICEEQPSIKTLFIGSGDGDYKPVLNLAKKKEIPATIIAVSEKSLSYRIQDKSDSIIFLFKK